VINTDKKDHFLRIEPGLDYEFILEDLELAFPKDQLKRVTKNWNDGSGLEEIAENEKREPLEILLALIHQAKRGFKLRPFAGRL